MINNEKQTEAQQMREQLNIMFDILEIREISDSGREFSPTTISSCRCMDLAKLEEAMSKLKVLAGRK